MNSMALVLAPFGLPFAYAGWWMRRNAARAADATIRLEQSSPTAKWLKPPGPRSRAFEVSGYRFIGAALVLLGSAFTLVNLLVGFGLVEPA